MKNNIGRVRGTAALACVLASAVAATTAAEPAAAYDSQPCFKRPGDTQRTFTWRGYEYAPAPISYCPLWRGMVPVRADRSQQTPVVGHLRVGGSVNWFIYERLGGRQHLPGSPTVWNHWWASTKADNGRWGWVNEIYFSGGRNGEQDRGLSAVPSSFPCVRPCPPLPPWVL